jgi:hypothetical protein
MLSGSTDPASLPTFVPHDWKACHCQVFVILTVTRSWYRQPLPCRFAVLIGQATTAARKPTQVFKHAYLEGIFMMPRDRASCAVVLLLLACQLTASAAAARTRPHVDCSAVNNIRTQSSDRLSSSRPRTEAAAHGSHWQLHAYAAVVNHIQQDRLHDRLQQQPHYLTWLLLPWTLQPHPSQPQQQLSGQSDLQDTFDDHIFYFSSRQQRTEQQVADRPTFFHGAEDSSLSSRHHSIQTGSASGQDCDAVCLQQHLPDAVPGNLELQAGGRPSRSGWQQQQQQQQQQQLLQQQQQVISAKGAWRLAWPSWSWAHSSRKLLWGRRQLLQLDLKRLQGTPQEEVDKDVTRLKLIQVRNQQSSTLCAGST